MVREDILDAHVACSLAQIANDVLWVDPPRRLKAHIKIVAGIQRWDVYESSLGILPPTLLNARSHAIVFEP